MADKKQDLLKPGVKFQDQATKEFPNKTAASIPHTPQTKYHSFPEQKELSLKCFNTVSSQLKVFTSQDQDCSRKDTALGLKSLLDQLKSTMEILNAGTFEDKTHSYFLLYNATIYMFEMCRLLRKSVYSSMVIEYLAYSIASIEGNLQLLSVKYLDWRVKLYTELAQVYFGLGSAACALRTIEMALAKVHELREIEEVDPPLPDYIERSLASNQRNLRILEMKFKVQSGFPVDQWKKKVEEYFGKDPEAKCTAILESLRLTPPANLVKQAGASVAFKEQVLVASYELVKADMDRVTLGLEQAMEKVTKTVEFKSALQDSYIKGEEEESIHKRVELTKKRREFESALIKERDWRRSALNFPLEYQVELAQHAYDCGNQKIFDEVSASAQVRCKYRRIEVPYIVDIDLKVANNPNPNIPNGYEKIPVDLNEASLRQELRKLRNRARQETTKEEPKKEEKKKETKQQQPVPQQTNVVDQVGMGVQATEQELSQIDHTYVFLVYKTSMIPEGAIYEIDLVMGDEESGPSLQLSDGYRAIAIPVRQYTGVRETTRQVPYLLIKHTMNALQDENQRLTLLTQLSPLFGKHPLIRASPGFEKLKLELRQTPREFIRSPNMDYLFLTYKIDKHYSINEREVQMMIKFNTLERSYLREKSVSLDDDARLELDLCYDINALQQLTHTLGKCLSGPLGQNYLQERKDYLSQLVFILWRKYLQSQLYQIEFIQELRITREMADEDYLRYQHWVNLAKLVFRETLLVMNQVLFQLPCDIVFLSKVNISLAKLSEEAGDFNVDNIQKCIEKIRIVRNTTLSRGVNSNKDHLLPFSLTCSARKIKLMVQQMKDSYIQTKNQINREIRLRQRQEQGSRPLEDDEINEEEYEVLEAQQNYLLDDNRDQAYFKELDNQIEIYQNDNVTKLIQALHADLLMISYRCQVKMGRTKKLKQSETQEIKGVSTQVLQKMTISKGPTAQTIKSNLNQLQSTLQKEGKLDPPNPHIHPYERTLMEQANKNPYANCLLYMILASNKNKPTEQKSLLQQSLEYLHIAEKEEELHIQNGIQDSIFVLSTQLDNIRQPLHAEQFFPFQMLYNPDYIKPSQIPRKPILICRTSDSVTLKLPPFKPKLLDVIGTDEAKKIINSMAIFGKVSANGVNVSLTCTDLPNTGTRQRIGGVIQITKLQSNEKYCFAAAGYDGNESVSNGIGETGDDITLLHPLPLPLLASYLSKTAYQLSNFDLAEEAALICINMFTEESKITDSMLGNQQSPLYVHRLVQERLREVGLIEINNLAETFLIKAKCMNRNLHEGSTPFHYQKNVLKVANYVLLGMETSIIVKNYPLSKRLCSESYNLLERFFDLYSLPIVVFNFLLKILLVLTEVPKQYWDSNLRILSAKCTYELLRATFQLNEITLGKRVLFQQLKTFNRKWYQIPKIVMIEEQTKDTQQVKDTKKDTKKPKVEEVQQEVQQVKLVPKLIREMYESSATLQDFLEDTVLSMHEEFGDLASQFIDKWRESIDSIVPYVENSQDQVDRALSDLSIRIEYWEYLREPASAYQKIQASFKGTPIYTEILCKLFRRMLETPNLDVKLINEQIINAAPDVPQSDPVRIAGEIRELQSTAISNDFEFYPAMLPYLKRELETSKQGNPVAIQVFENYFIKEEQLQQKLQEEQFPLQIGSMMLQAQKYEYIQLWTSEFNCLRAMVQYHLYKKDYKTIKEVQNDQFCNVQSMDLQRTIQLIQEDKQIIKTTTVVQQVAPVIQQTKPGAPQQKAPQQQTPVLSEDIAFKQMLEQTFKLMSVACSSALQSREYSVLINQIRFINNVIVNEQVTPFIHRGTDCWKYLTLCAMSVLKMLQQVREDGGIYKGRQERESVFQSVPHIEKTKVTKQVQKEPEPELPVLSTKLSKEFWFTNVRDLEMDILANFIAYTSQTLLVESKYKTLIGITREFCNVTTHYYSLYVLPFTVYAQQYLLNEAKPKRIAKEKQLEERTASFKLWEQTKKRKTRSSILTQEVAPEELEYIRDKLELEGQITLLLSNENFIQHELDHSEKLIGEIQRDANQAIEGLKQARKLYEKYAVDDRQLFEEFILGEQMNEPTTNYMKQRRKNHKQLGMQIISRYKLAIEVLRKRQEKFYLVLALRELGNLNYALDNHSQAEEMWSDALDTIFQKIYTLKNSAFRKMLSESTHPLAQQYGVLQCLIGLNITSTLATYSYDSNCNQQREACILASELVYSVFKIQMPNPMSWAAFIDSTNCEIQCQFTDKFTLDCAETAISCERMSWMLLDRDEPLRSLPLLNLLKSLSNTMSSAFYGVRAMLMRLIALTNLGAINESYQLLVKVASEKDLPLLPGTRNSHYLKKLNGEYWFNSTSWNNSTPPYDDKHFQLTDTILKELQLNRAFGLKYGLLNENLFNYALSSFLYSVHQHEVVEKWEINEQRTKILHRVDNILRSTIKKVGFEEELDLMIFQALNEENYMKLKGEDPQEFILKKKDEIIAFAKSNGGIQDPIELEAQYQLLRNGIPVGISNNEEGLTYPQRHEERLHMIARMRLLLAKVNLSLGLTTRALWIVKTGIDNLSRYIFEERRVETGDELENPISVEYIKPQGAVEEKKGAKVPKEDKKPTKGGKDTNKEEEDRKIQDEKTKKQQQQYNETAYKITLERKYKRSMNVYWWLKLRFEFLYILYRQNRFKEAWELCQQMRPELKTFNETLYTRVITEYSARILVKQGKFDEAVKHFEEALSLVHMYHQSDPGVCNLLGDYGELLLERKHYNEAYSLFRECTLLSESHLKSLNYNFGNNFNFNLGVEVAQELQIPKEQEEELLKRRDRQSKTSKKEDKKKDDKGGKKGPIDKGTSKIQPMVDRPQMKIQQINPLVHLKSEKFNYQFMDAETQSTAPPLNCYLKGVDIWIRSVLRRIHTQFLLSPIQEDSVSSVSNTPINQSNMTSESESESDHKNNNNQLEDLIDDKQLNELLLKVESSINHSFNIPVSFRVEVYYLQAILHKRSFIALLKKFQQMYFNKYLKDKNKKYRKFWERRPFRDLVRHKYFLEIPGYSQEMKETGLAKLNQAKDILKRALQVLRGEAVLYENFRKPEDILFEICEVCLLLREYRPRIGHKYIDSGDLQQQVDSKLQTQVDIETQLQKLERQDKLDQLNLELESASYLKYASEFVKARLELCEQPHSVGLQALTDTTKMPLDVYTEVVEQDYIYKRNYALFLFDESKKKVGVNSVDLLIFLQKVWREARLLTFTSPYLQRIISKVHRFLRVSLQTYQRCVINQLDVAPKADLNAIFVEEGIVVIRSQEVKIKEEQRFIYILGPLNRDKIISSLSKDERDKIIINEERETIYGTIYIHKTSLATLQQESYSLKTRMQASDQKQTKAKERDYRRHRKDFVGLIESVGSYYFLKNENVKESRRNKEESENGEYDLLDKYSPFVPELTHENIDFLINLLGENGVSQINNNYLVIFRYFHNNKYK